MASKTVVVIEAMQNIYAIESAVWRLAIRLENVQVCSQIVQMQSYDLQPVYLRHALNSILDALFVCKNTIPSCVGEYVEFSTVEITEVSSEFSIYQPTVQYPAAFRTVSCRSVYCTMANLIQ